MSILFRQLLGTSWVTIAIAVASTAGAATLEQKEKGIVLQAAAELLQSRYVDPVKGRLMAEAIRSDAERNAFASRLSHVEFAQALTLRLRALSGDGHLRVHHRDGPVSAEAETGLASFNSAELDKWYGPAVNHGVVTVSHLPGGNSYLDLRVFAPPSMGAPLALE